MSKKPRILIVEDESVVAMDLEQRLVERGYEVLGVVSTGDANDSESPRISAAGRYAMANCQSSKAN